MPSTEPRLQAKAVAVGIDREPELAIEPGGVAEKNPELGIIRRRLGGPLGKAGRASP